MTRRRSPGNELLGLLEAASCPIYLLDAERRFIFGNRAFAEWLRVAPEELWGQRCDACATSAELTAALAAPPALWGRVTMSGPLMVRLADESVTHRRATYFALGGTPSAVLVRVEPEEITAVAHPLGTERGEIASAGEQAGDSVSESESLRSELRAYLMTLRASYRHDILVGVSAAIQRVRAQVRVAIESRVRVLISGPVGANAEALARAIHAASDPEVIAPLLPVACELVPAEVLQTTIFGFLRRCQDQPAKTPGTLLLLNAERLSWEAQLELRAFLTLPTFSLRVIATAETRLVEFASQDRFDWELALALSTLEIALPPLSSRRKDIPYLAQQAVERWNARGGKQLAGFTVEALDCLCTLPWSGDFLEFQEIVQAACEQAVGPQVTFADLPRRVALLTSAAKHPTPVQEAPMQLDRFLSEVERELLERALRRARGNKARAARLLGIPRARLLRRIAQLGLATNE